MTATAGHRQEKLKPNGSGGRKKRQNRQRCPNSSRSSGEQQNQANASWPEEKFFGDKMDRAPNHSLRIVFLNHQGFAIDINTKEGKAKGDSLRKFIKDNNINVMLLAENNVHWQSIPASERLEERTSTWFNGLNMSNVYYKDFKPESRQQYGGCSAWCINETAYRVLKTGGDETGLGRWAWSILRGRNGIILRVIAAYRPVLSQYGATTVWNQQHTYFLEQGEDKCPRILFNEHLTMAIKKWMEEGEQIVLGIDYNDPINGKSDLEKRLKDIGVVNAIQHNHQSRAPPTRTPGTNTIDSIFCSKSLLSSKCGYMQFQNNYDHRPTWMDIPYNLALGHELPPVIRPQMRRLQTTNRKATNRYISNYWKFIKKHQLGEQAEALYKELPELETFGSMQCPFQPKQKEIYDQLDEQRLKGVLTAEKMCRKLRTGAHDWSVQYQALRWKYDYWKKTVDQLQGRKVDKHHLMKLAKQANISHETELTLEKARQNRSAAHKARMKFIPQAPQVREANVEAQANKAMEEGRLKEAQQIRDRWKHEQQRKDSRIIKRIMGKFSKGSMSFVVATDRDGNRTEMRKKEDIEQACLQENNRRFRQASNTPFLTNPLFEEVGPMGMGPGGEAILQGNFIIPEGTDPYAAQLIKHLAMTKEVKNAPPMEIGLDIQQFKRGWAKAKENTSSGRSGLHFGHCKAGIQHEGICRFEAIMANIPYQTGHSPPRWKKEISVMFQKKQDKHEVETMRTIMLMETDWNQNNKLLGRNTMARAEKFNTIAREQYGSRKAHSAIDHCINKRLTFDIIRQKRIPAAHLASDAVSCYDRIVHSVAALSMRARGAPAGPIICMFNTLQEMTHYVRTVFGDSEINFQSKDSDNEVPIQGVGQGNGAGPTIWAIVSSPVLDMLRESGCLCTFRMALTGEEVKFVGYAFVDDTDKVVTSPSPTATYKEVAELLQKSADTWEGGIRATGGAIGPDKSHYYLLEFIWKEGNFRYASPIEAPASVTILDKDGIRKTLERIEPNRAQKTLGVYLAPDGNDDDQFNALLEKSQVWADQVRAGHLPRRLALQSLKQSLWMSLKWPLAATCLSEEQCKDIMRPALKAGLPRIGFVSGFPRDLVHAPKQYLGLAIPNLYAHQLANHIQKMLLFCQSTSLTGELIRTSMQQLKVELGANGPIFELPYKTYGRLATRSWITTTWKDMQSNGISVIDSTPEIPKRTQNDLLIIPTFAKAGFKPYELMQLNKMRLYLQVATLADLVQANGKDVITEIWNGTIPSRCRPEIDWPRQGELSNEQRTLWQTALKTCFGLSPERRRGCTHKLGAWIESKNKWEWHYHQSTERLYQRNPTGWIEWHHIPGRPSRQTRMNFSYPEIANEVPANLIRASIYKRGELRCLQSLEEEPMCLEPAISITTNKVELREAIAELPESAKWAVQECYYRTIERDKPPFEDNGETLANAIQSPEGMICISDGSFKDASGTACFTLLGSTKKGSIICPMVVPGEKTVQDAYRAELSGIYGAVVLVHLLCIVHNIQQGNVQVGCDGLSALRRAIDQSGDVNPNTPHFDIIAAIRYWKNKSPITWTSKHVLGHQDKNPWNVLDRAAFHNCEMDQLAKERWQILQSEEIPSNAFRISGEPWPIYIKGRKISNKLQEAVYEQISGGKAKEYWNNHKQRFGDGSTEDVDLQATGDTMRMMPIARQHWLVKHAAGFNAVGKNMKRRKQWTHSKCPRCSHAMEDSEHVTKCQGPGATEQWEKSIMELEEWMKKNKTDRNIIRAISQGLNAWNTEQPVETEIFSQPIRATIAQQTKIGWRNLLEGFPAKRWAQHQEEYFKQIGSKRSSRRWKAALVKKLAEVTWQMWDHRNSVNNENETATMSIEVNKKIEEEYNQGFGNLSSAAKKLAQQPKELLMTKGLNYRQQWLRTITANREFIESQKSKNQAPKEILDGQGYVWWVRNGKPSLEEYRERGFGND